MKILKNKEVKEFFQASLLIYNEAVLKVEENFNSKIERWKSIDFVKFDCNNPYEGVCKNKIFIYHHNHYRGNSSTDCSAEFLIHPHTNMED